MTEILEHYNGKRGIQNKWKGVGKKGQICENDFIVRKTQKEGVRTGKVKTRMRAEEN